jgi:hypothetical protein
MATQVATADRESEARQSPAKLTLAPLIALVPGSMISGGVFNLREAGQRVFTMVEAVIAVAVVAFGVYASAHMDRSDQSILSRI